jgi:colicin import membrane protein
MKRLLRAYTAEGVRSPLLWPFLISLAGHLLIFGYIVFKADFRPGIDFNPTAMNVQMVSLADLPAAAPAAKAQSQEGAPVVEKRVPAPKEPPAKVEPKQPAAEAEVSTATTPPKVKTSLKYQTFKPDKVLEKTMRRLEKRVESAPPRPLEDTFKRLREEVAKGEKSAEGDTSGAAEGATGNTPQGTGAAPFGPAVGGGRGEIELIDLYRMEIAYQVQKNWAFAEQMAGTSKKMMASIVFKVMPDGAINDIFFTDRSGNSYLDESAYKAIVKSSPVKPHPSGLRVAYIEMGLRFTPEGVN